MQLFDGVLDGQAVAVPARHVQRVEAFELAALDDHVLERLVHRMADVDLAVGVGRAVMQDELGRAVARVAQLLVEPLVLPFLDPADRKSTRLNSSHSQISYAVFCLKKKK